MIQICAECGEETFCLKCASYKAYSNFEKAIIILSHLTYEEIIAIRHHCWKLEPQLEARMKIRIEEIERNHLRQKKDEEY